MLVQNKQDPHLSQMQEFVVDGSISSPVRFDKYASDVLGLATRSQLKSRVTEWRLNGKLVKPSADVVSGDRLALTLAPLPSHELIPEAMDLNIIHEDEHVLVLDKAPGLVVHPGAGNWTGTLVHGLLHHAHELGELEADDELRPGIVHRLDKETSGVMIVAKDEATHAFLAGQFAERRVVKAYIALVSGEPRTTSWVQDGFIVRDPGMRQRFMVDTSKGKPASTEFTILASSGKYHLVLAFPKTGRTHQIRVHLHHAKLPIVGDSLYGKSGRGLASRCMLHAWVLHLAIPQVGASQLFIAKPHQDMIECARSIGIDLESVLKVKGEGLVRAYLDRKG